MKETPGIENEIMNPQITDVEVGIRNLRKIKIYPLSMGCQLKVTEIIEKAIVGYITANPDGDSAISMATAIIKTISDNINVILGYVTDFEKKEISELIEDLSNMQASEIVMIIYEKNFKDPYEKNLKSLFEKVRGTIFQPERPLPQSSKNTETTE